MRITLETDRDGRAALLSVHDVDTVTAGPLIDMLAVAQMTGAFDVVVDLRRVDRLDLLACAALARASRTLASRNGRLRLVCAPACERAPLHLLGLDGEILASTLAEAGWVAPQPDRAGRPARTRVPGVARVLAAVVRTTVPRSARTFGPGTRAATAGR